MIRHAWTCTLQKEILTDFYEASLLGRRREWLPDHFTVIKAPTGPGVRSTEAYGQPCKVERRTCPDCGAAIERREGVSREIHFGLGYYGRCAGKRAA